MLHNLSMLLPHNRDANYGQTLSSVIGRRDFESKLCQNTGLMNPSSKNVTTFPRLSVKFRIENSIMQRGIKRGLQLDIRSSTGNNVGYVDERKKPQLLRNSLFAIPELFMPVSFYRPLLKHPQSNSSSHQASMTRYENPNIINCSLIPHLLKNCSLIPQTRSQTTEVPGL